MDTLTMKAAPPRGEQSDAPAYACYRGVLALGSTGARSVDDGVDPGRLLFIPHALLEQGLTRYQRDVSVLWSPHHAENRRH
jgi:hypothetical protein